MNITDEQLDSIVVLKLARGTPPEALKEYAHAVADLAVSYVLSEALKMTEEGGGDITGFIAYTIFLEAKREYCALHAPDGVDIGGHTLDAAQMAGCKAVVTATLAKVSLHSSA